MRSFRLTAIAPLLLTTACGGGAVSFPDPSQTPAVGSVPVTIRYPNVYMEAEILALETFEKIQVDRSEYEAIANDLLTIRATFPELATITAAPSWSVDSIFVTLDDEAEGKFRSGTFTTWDSLNTQFKLKQIEDFTIMPNTHLLTFDGRYNTQRLAIEFSDIAGINNASPNSIGGDSSDICLTLTPTRRYYVFDAAYGDCPAGCIHHTYDVFAVDDFGNVVQVESTNTRSFQAPIDCANRL